MGRANSASPNVGPLVWLWTRRIKVVGCAGLLFFASLVAGFYDRGTGFTSLLSIGAKLDSNTVTKLRQVPHYVYDESYGYDGAYYVQLALHPTLTEPELRTSIDNLPYRAKRMLLYWLAALLGFGRDEWIVNAYALLNVFAWFALAAVLLRWFPLTSWGNLLRWGGVLFSHGVCMSVRNSLVDLPSLLLVALAVAWIERGRRAGAVGALGLAVLTKETSALAAVALFDPKAKGVAGWVRLAALAVLVMAPLLAWSAYVRWRVGAGESGLNNFTWPLLGLAEKWAVTFHDLGSHGWGEAYVGSLLAVLALTVQAVFLLLWWKPAIAWWRVGATFVLLLAVVSEPVWEGYPGAAPRVLLPMTLAFNVLVPRGRRWLPLLVVGNLTVLMALQELRAPVEFYRVRGESTVVAALQVERTGAWHGLENDGSQRWRWSAGESGFHFLNRSARPLRLEFKGRISSALDDRRVTIVAGGASRWAEKVTGSATEFAFACEIPPGESTVQFSTDQPARQVKTDPRPLAFKVANLEIVVRAATGQP